MRFPTHLVVSVLCGAALLAAPSTSSAGSPPPPPWRPTNTLKFYFVLNNDLRRAGELCTPSQPCPTGPQLVQRKIDYLNAVFEANRVNLKAASVGIWEHPGNIHHEAAIDPRHGLLKRRRDAGADLLFVVNTYHNGSAHGQANIETNIGWIAQRTVFYDSTNPSQMFAHEVGHFLGAGHLPGQKNVRAPYAVGWGNWTVGDIMRREDSVGRVDHYSDHETRAGSPTQSVGRYLREQYGRYSRYTGTAPPPDRRPICCGISTGR